MKTLTTFTKNGLLGLALLATACAYAQTPKNIKKLEKEAFNYFVTQNYDKALPLYLKLDEVSADKQRYDYMIGMCYLSSNDKMKAIPYLESAKSHATTSFVVNYYLGRSYMIAGKYEEAIQHFEAYNMNLKPLVEKGLRFSTPKNVTETNSVHVEKTLGHVNNFISNCEKQIYADGGKSKASIEGNFKITE